MYAKLDKVFDPRPHVKMYSRKELEYIARHEGRLGKDIQSGMPAELMQRRLAENPPSVWPIPVRRALGTMAQPLRIPPFEAWVAWAYQQHVSAPVVQESVKEVDAADDLERQWKESQDFSSMPFYKLKQECKKREIKFARTDKKTDLLRKLNGENAP
ncbi:MAG: hypothetical protein OES09_11250 [Gammaproteobacteria bacterium]|nr:hypothetical protein [Gammaproteobacteria bacterium]